MPKIHKVIRVIISWIEKLKYPNKSMKYIRFYHSAMSEWDKKLIAKTFNIAEDKNTKYTIIIATDTYDIGINNPDIRLVIQLNIPMTFDSMI